MGASEPTAADRTFRAIADPTRRRILQLLAANALTVGAIGAHFDISQPAVSQHLRVLRDCGLVEARAEWRHRTYHLRPDQLRTVLEWVRYFEQFWDDALDRLDHVIDEIDPPGV